MRQARDGCLGTVLVSYLVTHQQIPILTLLKEVRQDLRSVTVCRINFNPRSPLGRAEWRCMEREYAQGKSCIHYPFVPSA